MAHIDPIYVVDTFSTFDTSSEIPEMGHRRCVGWFPTFEEAQTAVLKNLGDIYELGSYPYAQIEEVEPGMYGADPTKRWWYRWSDGKYRSRRYPPELDHVDICGIG